MARFCPLFSGSSGNSIYIGNADGGILVDAGKSAKQTEKALYDIGVAPESIHAIFVTHEHFDHISGVRVFASRYHTAVFATAGTLAALEENGTCNGKFKTDVISARGTQAGSFLITPFATSHDCRESCGYKINCSDGRTIAVATDLGEMTDTVMQALTGCDLVLLESNHDVMMLQNGPYPFPLKQRILGRLGHLSNEICAETAVKLIESGTTRLILGHLSQENNVPQLAYQTTYSSLLSAGAKQNADYILKVAKPVCDEKAMVL